MEILRTPDERFANLPEYPFAPHYQMLGDVRVHYLDEGSPTAEPVLLLHGEPSWSFLYRKMIPILVAAGYRVIAPDLIGFGRSDKPTARADYTYQRHVDWMWDLVSVLDLHAITLVCQDWGGLIGLRLAAEHPDHFARIVAANTGFPTGDQPMGRAFMTWQKLSQRAETLDIAAIIQNGCQTTLPPEVLTAYDAPFPDERYKAGARQFPLLVPTTPDDPAAPANRAAWQVLRQWTKPFLTAFSAGDPITRGVEISFQETIPGAKGQAHVVLPDAGHFLQEDQGAALSHVVIAFMHQ